MENSYKDIIGISKIRSTRLEKKNLFPIYITHVAPK